MQNDIQIWRREFKGVASNGPAFFVKQESLPIETDSGVWGWGSVDGQKIEPET